MTSPSWDLHSKLGYVSPNNYEANMAMKQPISVS